MHEHSHVQRPDRRFRDLRARQEYSFRVAKMRPIKRERRIDRVIELQRQHRLRLPR